MRIKTSIEMWTYKGLMCKTWQDIGTGEWVWTVTEITNTAPLAGGLAYSEDDAKSKAELYCDKKGL